MGVFYEISINDPKDYPFIRAIVLTDCTRFEQQQDPLGCISVGVMLTTDLMNDVVAESHVAKRARLARGPKPFPVFVENPLDFLRNDQMVRVGLTVYQIRPIQVAA